MVAYGLLAVTFIVALVFSVLDRDLATQYSWILVLLILINVLYIQIGIMKKTNKFK